MGDGREREKGRAHRERREGEEREDQNVWIAGQWYHPYKQIRTAMTKSDGEETLDWNAPNTYLNVLPPEREKRREG